MSEIVLELKDKMAKTISVLKEELVSIRAGRANTMLLDKVVVEYYGTPTPIKQLASVSTPEPRMIQVQPYDASILKEIEKAIQMANLGMNPSNDGKVIRLMLPILTEERRTELTKQVKKIGEDSKVAIRNERRTALEGAKKLEKAKEITEDELSHLEKEIQKHVDEAIANIDKVIQEKNNEIMEV